MQWLQDNIRKLALCLWRQILSRIRAIKIAPMIIAITTTGAMMAVSAVLEMEVIGVIGELVVGTLSRVKEVPEGELAWIEVEPACAHKTVI